MSSSSSSFFLVLFRDFAVNLENLDNSQNDADDLVDDEGGENPAQLDAIVPHERGDAFVTANVHPRVFSRGLEETAFIFGGEFLKVFADVHFAASGRVREFETCCDEHEKAIDANDKVELTEFMSLYQ